MSHPRYCKVPITEALIDLRVTLPKSVGVPELAAVEKAISSEYPTKQPMSVMVGLFQLAEKTSDVQGKEVGFLYKEARTRFAEATTGSYKAKRKSLSGIDASRREG